MPTDFALLRPTAFLRIGNANGLCTPTRRPRPGCSGAGGGACGGAARTVRSTPALPLTQWPEGRAQLGREELRLLTSTRTGSNVAKWTDSSLHSSHVHSSHVKLLRTDS